MPVSVSRLRRKQSTNETLRQLIESSGLTQRAALARFNRGLGAAAYSESAWKAFLASPTTTRFRRLSPQLLEHARTALEGLQMAKRKK